MGDALAVAMLADATSSIRTFIDVFISVYIVLILAYVLSSWVRVPYSSPLQHVLRFLHDVCAPYLGLFRKVVPPLGPFDLSPMIGVLVLVVLDRLIAQLI